MKLHNWIFIGMIGGVLAGMGLFMVHDPTRPDATPPAWYGYATWTLDLLGPTLFIGVLKMIIAPLILSSIVAGVTSLPDIRELGAIGWKTLVFYATTTTIAVSLGILCVMTIRPGEWTSSQSLRMSVEAQQQELRQRFEAQSGRPALVGDQLDPQYLAWLTAEKEAAAGGTGDSQLQTMAAAKDLTPGRIFVESIVQPMLMNPFQSLASNPPNALGIIFFALLLGIACTVLGPVAEPVVRFFAGLAEVMLKITHWVMLVAPVAIGCLVAKIVAETGPGVFASLGAYAATVAIGIVIHVTFLLSVAYGIGGKSLPEMWRGLREAWLIALTTRSSAATLPVTIANVTEKLGVSPKVANFSLPLGATMNMDGTALYQSVAIIFLIQLFGGMDDVHIPLNFGNIMLILITAVAASVGAAAVPSAGLVTMVIVATAVNLPIYYLTFIFAIDAVLDMLRTSTNVLGDAVGSVVVNRLERHRLDALSHPTP